VERRREGKGNREWWGERSGSSSKRGSGSSGRKGKERRGNKILDEKTWICFGNDWIRRIER